MGNWAARACYCQACMGGPAILEVEENHGFMSQSSACESSRKTAKSPAPSRSRL